MAVEADLELESLSYDGHDHDHHHHHGRGDVETLPMIQYGVPRLFQGKPSKAIVDSLAVFGARKHYAFAIHLELGFLGVAP